MKERLELITLPDAWVCRMEARSKPFSRHTLINLNKKYSEVTGNPYMFLGNEFYPDVKFVHFTHMNNHPHEWEKYNLFV